MNRLLAVILLLYQDLPTHPQTLYANYSLPEPGENVWVRGYSYNVVVATRYIIKKETHTERYKEQSPEVTKTIILYKQC